MEGRELPGFFWDAQKKRYFRVLANHVAPEGVKYSHENVKKEKEQTRKRKRHAAHQQKKEIQTVHRSRILQSALITGVGLAREQGASTARSLEARTVALAKEYQPEEIVRLKTCESCGRQETVFDFVVDKETDALFVGMGSSHFGRLQYLANDLNDIAIFRSNISSISLTNSRTIVATSASNLSPGNVFVAGLSEPSGPEGSFPILDSPAPSFMFLGPSENSLWTSAPNPPGGKDIVAIGGSEASYMLSNEGRVLQTYHPGHNSDVRALDWLSPNTAVGGTRKRTVLLWDARTGGTSTRFYHSSGVTAVKSLENGNQVVVCGFDGMAMYDVRMPAKQTPKFNYKQPSTPVFKMPFKTERPSVAMDVSSDANMVATADDANVVQLHSLSTGRMVGALGKPDDSKDKKFFTRLRFLENRERPTLMACQGSTLLEWTWGGPDDDEG